MQSHQPSDPLTEALNRIGQLESQGKELERTIAALKQELADVTQQREMISSALQNDAVLGVTSQKYRDVKQHSESAIRAKDMALRSGVDMRRRLQEWQQLDATNADLFGTVWLRVRRTMDDYIRKTRVGEPTGNETLSDPITYAHVQAIREIYSTAMKERKNAVDEAKQMSTQLGELDASLELQERKLATSTKAIEQLRERISIAESQGRALDTPGQERRAEVRHTPGPSPRHAGLRTPIPSSSPRLSIPATTPRGPIDIPEGSPSPIPSDDRLAAALGY